MYDLIRLSELLDFDAAQGWQAIGATALAEHYYPPGNVGWPLVVLDVVDRRIAADIQTTLSVAYPRSHEVMAITPPDDESAGVLVHVPLGELGEFDGFGPSSMVYVPPLQASHDFTDLQETVAHLRSPVGCPWDREQTLASLRQDLLSECMEAIEAIDLDLDERDNASHIAEELGDVLLLVTMMIQIAIDEGRFQMADVVEHIVTKLIRRHPHVFGDTAVSGSDDVTANWDAIKAQEKAEKGIVVDSPLAGVPAELPALEKARELQSKAAKAGLLNRTALAQSLPGLDRFLGPAPSEEAMGELLWVLVAVAREYDIVAENALRRYAVGYRQTIEDGLDSSQDD